MSATPSEFVFGLFKILPVVKLHWVGLEPKIKVTKIDVFNNRFLKEIETKNYIFCNSIHIIEDIIKRLGITDYRLICGNSNTTKLKKSTINDPKAKYTFITSTGFESIDITDKDADILIYMDENKPHTLLTRNNIIQILGRFRNGYKSFVIYSKKGDLQCNQVDVLAAKEQQKLIPVINSYIDLDVTFGQQKADIFCQMNPYLQIINNRCQFNFPKYWNDYYYCMKVVGYKNLDFSFTSLRELKVKKSKNCGLKDIIKDIDNHTSSPKYSAIKACIDKIGVENTLKLTYKQIKMYATDGLSINQIKTALGYKPGEFKSCKEIKQDLKDLGVRGKITEFYYCKSAVKKCNGLKIRGYIF